MNFEYHNGQLMAEQVSLSDIAADLGTPLYVYSQAAFTSALDSFEAAFKDIPHHTCFAIKALDNKSILRLVAERGMGADIVSGGELFKARGAGIAPDKIIFSGVGKTVKEMKEALNTGILMFSVESQEEMAVLAAVAAGEGRKAPLCIRVNPDVDPGTHKYVATGLKESKFGLDPDAAFELFKIAAKDPNLEPLGLSCHIGSQLLSPEPFVEAAEKLKILVLKLKDAGIQLKYFDMGGGLGISYSHENVPPSLGEYAAGLKKVLAELPEITLVLEPGRYISGNSAVMLIEVLYNKTNGDKRFVVTTGAMNDLGRPSLYGSYHEILPLKENDGEKLTADVVGPICESSDFLAKDRALPKFEAGDILAVMSAGAYGFTMSSNYNSRPRPAEVLVSGDKYRVIKTRETYEDLVRGE